MLKSSLSLLRRYSLRFINGSRFSAFNQRSRFSCTWRKSWPPVRASPGRLRQIVLSLIANAKEAMDGQGGAEIQLTATPSADGVMIVVEDAGSGIDDDIKDRICDAFFTTKNPESHIGLGLTVARAAVESWGGSLSIDAGNDCGTRVGLWLPSWER